MSQRAAVQQAGEPSSGEPPSGPAPVSTCLPLCMLEVQAVAFLPADMGSLLLGVRASKELTGTPRMFRHVWTL